MELEDWNDMDYEMTWKGRLKLWLFVTWINNIRSPICTWIDKVAIRWLEGRQYHVEDYESEPPRTEITNGIHYCSRCGTGLGIEGDCFDFVDKEKRMKYYHELTKDEWEALLEKKLTWGELAELHPQPEWCGYPGALMGEMGCWSLTMIECEVSKEFCKSCDCFRGE